MLDKSNFVADDVVQREVLLADGKKHKLHFKEYSGAAFTKHLHALRSPDPEQQAGSTAVLVAASLCEPDGSPSITYEQAMLLKPAVLNAIFGAVLDVNKVVAPEEGKDSRSEATTGSGTSSPSDSAAAQ